MRITQALLGEHGAMYPLLDLIEKNSAEASLDQLKTQAGLLRSTLVSHADLEDRLLRPAILAHLPATNGGPTDHQVIGAGLDRVLAACAAEEARAAMLETVGKTRKHFHKEESIIFGIAERELSRELQEQLGADWAASRRVLVGS